VVSGPGRPARLGTALAAVVCLGGVLLAATLERRSLEHANRLHRRGELASAARAYGDRAAGDSSASAVHYNFGTTLLELGSPAAPAQLGRTTESEDPELRGEALYNLGLWNLRRARDVSSADSVLAYATAAAGANKEALRLEPGRYDARWNLALALRMLDSINADDGRAGTESVDGMNDTDDEVSSDDLREFEDPSDVDEAPRQGSDEALAQSEEGTELSLAEAEAILGADPDRSVIVRKLLTYQGRIQRRPFGSRAGPRW
jgi:hypothetical protein